MLPWRNIPTAILRLPWFQKDFFQSSICIVVQYPCQKFSHVEKEPPLPGYLPVLWWKKR